MKPKKSAKLRLAAAGLVAGAGMSLLALLTPASASADPWIPYTGPLHPVRHYAADIIDPFWALTHPIRAAIP